MVRGGEIQLIVDGVMVPAFEGETVGIALAASGYLELRTSPSHGEARGMFCLMGVCQECVVEVDGHTAPACITLVHDLMRITTDSLSVQRRSALGEEVHK